MLNGIITRIADVTANGDTTTTLTNFLNSIKGGLADFSTGNLAKVMLVGLGFAVPLFLCWFGYRFVKRKATGAIQSGRL